MSHRIPVWVVLCLLFISAMTAVAFGALVRHALLVRQSQGLLNQAALKISAFPARTVDVFKLIFAIEPPYAEIQAALPDFNLKEFRPLAIAEGLGHTITPPLVHVQGHPMPGYRVLIGVFVIDGKVDHAALLLDSNLKIVHIWGLYDAAAQRVHGVPVGRTLVHGFAVLSDKSVVSTLYSTNTLQRLSASGERIWAIPGDYHHAVKAADDEKSVWALRYGPDLGKWDGRTAVRSLGANRNTPEGNWIVRIAVADGRILEEFTIQDVIEANPDIDALGVRRLDEDGSPGNEPGQAGVWLPDPFHLNDVDPLPANLAADFPQFSAGDLLLSARSLNLLCVVNPHSKQIRWWRIGVAQRQHDPDWLPSGRISVFNNRMSKDYSSIISIDPRSNEFTEVFNGRAARFFSRIRGKHQHLPNGNILIASAQQGRVLEVKPDDGSVMLDLVNVDPESEGRVFLLTQAIWLPPDFFIRSKGL